MRLKHNSNIALLILQLLEVQAHKYKTEIEGDYMVKWTTSDKLWHTNNNEICNQEILVEYVTPSEQCAKFKGISA